MEYADGPGASARGGDLGGGGADDQELHAALACGGHLPDSHARLSGGGLRIQQADLLHRGITLYMVTAWWIMLMTLLGRASCDMTRR